MEVLGYLSLLLNCLCVIIITLHVTGVIRDMYILQGSSNYDGANNVCNFGHLLDFILSYNDSYDRHQMDSFFNLCSIPESTRMLLQDLILNTLYTRGINRNVLRSQESANTTSGQSTPVSAHKRLKPYKGSDSEQADRTGAKHYTLTFDTETVTSDTSEHVRGSVVLQDGLQIQYAGLYYIYSNVSYKRNPVLHQNKSDHKSWHTYLHRVSPNRPWNSGVLLRSSHTPCIECLKHEENRYIGGVFYLLQGDIIQICLSNPNIDNFNSETSFVGFFKLSS